MKALDWMVMLGTLFVIVAYGIWKTRHIRTARSYLRGDDDLKWWTIGLSIMATQASAITFLSTPGQAYDDGMRFVQFYFGMPFAMVFLCIVVLPIFYRLKVYTAYEYLENRFDLKTRTLTAILFLISRGLAAGMTIYAPSIILSAIMDWSLNWTIFLMGIFVIFYTMMGGTKAVSVTQKQQMVVILAGMFVAAAILVFKLPQDVRFGDAIRIAGKMDKLNTIDFRFDWENRYNFWTGMFASVFLFLSYFGADQSQVQRYLSGISLKEGRIGLLFNGILKVPMQFLILLIGVLVFVFFLFNRPPVHFNSANLKYLQNTAVQSQYQTLEKQHAAVFEQQRAEIRQLLHAMQTDNESAVQAAQSRIAELRRQDAAIRTDVKKLIAQQAPKAQTNDRDYVFLNFVIHYLPTGIIGLLLAVIFSAAWSSTASELSALATTTVVDIYRRSFVPEATDRHYLRASKWFTVLWGGIALGFAVIADLFENLIQAVNIIGSLFYGVILGIFFTAFFLKKVGGRSAFIAGIIGEAIVLGVYFFGSVAFLWLNLIGCVAVMAFAAMIQAFSSEKV